MNYTKLPPTSTKSPKLKLFSSLFYFTLLLLTVIDVQMVRLGDFPMSGDHWPYWEEYSEGEPPDIDESQTRDNTNVLKWFSDRVVRKGVFPFPKNYEILLIGDLGGFGEGEVQFCEVGCKVGRGSDVAKATAVLVNASSWENVKDLERLGIFFNLIFIF